MAGGARDGGGDGDAPEVNELGLGGHVVLRPPRHPNSFSTPQQLRGGNSGYHHKSGGVPQRARLSGAGDNSVVAPMAIVPFADLASPVVRKPFRTRAQITDVTRAAGLELPCPAACTTKGRHNPSNPLGAPLAPVKAACHLFVAYRPMPAAPNNTMLYPIQLLIIRPDAFCVSSSAVQAR